MKRGSRLSNTTWQRESFIFESKWLFVLIFEYNCAWYSGTPSWAPSRQESSRRCTCSLFPPRSRGSPRVSTAPRLGLGHQTSAWHSSIWVWPPLRPALVEKGVQDVGLGRRAPWSGIHVSVNQGGWIKTNAMSPENILMRLSKIVWETREVTLASSLIQPLDESLLTLFT